MLKPPDDDLFRQSTMTFGEHLEELRRRLFRAVFWLMIGLFVGLFIGRAVVRIIESPLTQALTEYYADKARAALKEKYGDLPPDIAELLEDGYVSEQRFVEPSKVIEAISQINTAAAAPAARIPTYRIVASDIRDPQSLADALNSAGADETNFTPARRVWERLRPADRRLISVIVDRRYPKPDLKQMDQVANGLNRIIGDDDFYSQSYFPDSSLPREAADLLKRRVEAKPERIYAG